MRRLKTLLLSKKFLISYLIFVFAFTLIVTSHHLFITHYEEGDICIRGIVISSKKTDYGIQFEIFAKEKVLVFMKEQDIDLGDEVRVCGTLKKPKKNTNFLLFSYRDYLLSNGISFQMEGAVLKERKKEVSILYTVKKHLSSYLSSFHSSTYLKTFLLGENELSSKRELFSRLGIQHLFSVSGMHMNFLIFLFGKFTKKKRWISIFLFFYVLLTGMSPSTIRAFGTFLFLSYRKEMKVTTFLLYFMGLMLLINPYFIYHTGFLYSFSISFSLSYFSPYFKRKRGYFKKLFSISLVAFLMGLPISLKSSYEFFPLSIAWNLFFVPIVSFLLFPFSFLVFFFPFLDSFYSLLLELFEGCATFLSKFSFSIILGSPKFFWLFFLFSFFACMGFLERDLKKMLPLLFLLFFQFFHPYWNPNPILTMLDVGQGNAMLIELPYRKGVLLFDTGGKIMDGEYTYPISRDILLPVLKSKGIFRISELVLSHGDFDHAGEAINLVQHFKVERVIFNCGPYNDLEQELIKVLDKKHIKYSSCMKGLHIDTNKFYFLNTKEYDNENDNSSVIYTEFDGYKFMFMGDAGIEKEKDILRKYHLSDIDVLMVGHHGSKTSSSKEFINEINPKYSLISVGKNNRYGHPNKEVLDNLDNSIIYRTDEDGSIMFKIKNNKLRIETCSP